MKQLNLFFEGETSKYFDGYRNLYIGDKDFIFANDQISITAEIKTISKNNTFQGKKLTYNQAREYASQVDLIDNLNRHTKCYLNTSTRIIRFYKSKNVIFVQIQTIQSMVSW